MIIDPERRSVTVHRRSEAGWTAEELKAGDTVEVFTTCDALHIGTFFD